MSNEASACIPAMAPRNASTDRAQREALTTFVGALLLGVTTRALLVGDPRGLHFLLWDVSVVAAMVFAFGRGRVAPSAWGAITACIGFGAATALRASPWAATIAVPWAFALCAVLPVLLLEPKRLEGLPSVLFASIARLRHAPDAFVETATLPIAASGGARRGPLLRALKGLAIGVPVASVFAVLLAGDPAFAGVLRRAFSHGNRTVSFALGSLALAAAYAFVYRLHARPSATAAPSPPPQAATAYRDGGAFDPLEAIAPRARPSARSAAPRVTPMTWAWVLLPVTAMFALFVALNVRHLFRGHALVHDPLGPTYAAYLHAGFYQLLAATVLAVCLVLVGHLLLRPRSSEAHEPVAGGRALTAVECALVLLTTVTLVSCFDRLAIYEDAYGATYRRPGSR